MALPEWPIASFAPLQSSLSGITPMRDPIVTEMEGGNLRIRSRPGDRVATVPMTIRMPNSQYATLKSWIEGALGNGTGRFRMNVWDGSGFVSRVCISAKGGAGFKPSFVGDEFTDVSMTLLVFDF